MSRAAGVLVPAVGARSWVPIGGLIVGSLVSVAATVFGNGNVAIAVAPVFCVAVLLLIWFAPLRIPLMTVIFLSLTIDSIDEGPWNSPLAALGSLLANNLNKTIPIDALSVPGIAVVLAYFLLVHFHRYVAEVRTDAVGRTPTAPVLIQALMVSFVAVLAVIALGWKSGGDVQMAKVQVQAYVLVLIVAYLVSVSFRGLADYRRFGALVVTAACIKAVIAVYVMRTVVPAPEFATTHGDSLLFACATLLLIVRFAEEPIKRNAAFCVALLPLLAAGMVANDRRLVWVQVLGGLVCFWLMARRSRFKRFIANSLLCALPLLVVYVAVGWSSQSKIFAPVQTLRSVGDSEVDASTLYRDLENYNLMQTIRYAMFTGVGFGLPFNEAVTLPNISFFEEYRYLPHNAILGLWAFCGPLGFAGVMFAPFVGVYLAARSYRHARHADERTAAFIVIAIVLVFLIHCWGDIGFSERRTIHLLGPALALAGQLAASTGAWRRTVRR